MISPSLTPNADAVKLAIEQMRVQMMPGMAKAGQIGVISRVTFSVATAAALALANEGDLHSSRGDMLEGIVNAIANVVVQTSKTLFGEENAPLGLLAITQKVGNAVADAASGVRFEGPVVVVPVEQMGEA